ncbi:MAG: OmpA family protein [Syntrophales bacterium]|jgi:chemotaxis protein MotB|nr:OmpA family protein [Syntrophales bacterium]MDY0043108.1 OmpA family protein [Syntrophales bacterium]
MLNHTLRKKKTVLAAVTWDSIYCSLVLILVAFFAMLVSYSTIDGGKTTNFMRGFGGTSKKGMDGLMSYGAEGFKTGKGKSIVRPSKEIMESEYTQPEPSLPLIKKYIRDLGLGNSVKIENTCGGFKAIFEDDILFSPGSAEIYQPLYPCLDRLCRIAKDTEYCVRIEGHTDTVPIHTTQFPSNWELSAYRAARVLRYFTESGGIRRDKITAMGFGQYRPVASNDTMEGRKKNRRVECHFEKRAGLDSGNGKKYNGQTPK